MIATIIATLVLIKELLNNKKLRKIMKMIYDLILELIKRDDYESVDIFLNRYMEHIPSNNILNEHIINLITPYKSKLSNYDKFLVYADKK